MDHRVHNCIHFAVVSPSLACRSESCFVSDAGTVDTCYEAMQACRCLSPVLIEPLPRIQAKHTPSFRLYFTPRQGCYDLLRHRSSHAAPHNITDSNYQTDP